MDKKPVMKIGMLVTDNREVSGRYSEPGPDLGPAPRALLEGLAKISDCEVHLVFCNHQPIPCRQKLADNIYYHPLVVGKWGWMRGGYAGCIQAIRAKLRQIKPDVAHAQGTERYCALAAHYSGYPCVLTIHGNMREIARVNRARMFSFLWLAARLERFVLPRVAGVICISGYTQRQVSGLARRTWLVPNAVEARFYDIDRKTEGAPRLFCPANISVRKNQVALVRALEPLAAEREFQVDFCGAAPGDDPYVQQFLGLLGQRPWCRFAGLLNRDEVAQALARSAALVLPCIEDNCPMAVLEAMAAGLPVAAANVGGVPDLIQHGVTGLLFDPHKPESIRFAVARLLDNNEELSRFAAAARAKALSCFHPNRIARQHAEIYRQIEHEHGAVPINHIGR